MEDCKLHYDFYGPGIGFDDGIYHRPAIANDEEIYQRRLMAYAAIDADLHVNGPRSESICPISGGILMTVPRSMYRVWRHSRRARTSSRIDRIRWPFCHKEENLIFVFLIYFGDISIFCPLCFVLKCKWLRFRCDFFPAADASSLAYWRRCDRDCRTTTRRLVIISFDGFLVCAQNYCLIIMYLAYHLWRSLHKYENVFIHSMLSFSLSPPSLFLSLSPPLCAGSLHARIGDARSAVRDRRPSLSALFAPPSHFASFHSERNEEYDLFDSHVKGY